MREDENPSNYHSAGRGVLWARGAAVEGLRVHRKHRGLPPPTWEDFLEEVMFQRDPEAQKGLGQGNVVGEGISSSGSSSDKTQAGLCPGCSLQLSSAPEVTKKNIVSRALASPVKGCQEEGRSWSW